MHRTVLRACALFAVLVLAFTACGDDANPGASPSATETEGEGEGTEDCSGDALAFEDTGLPEDFPQLGEAVLTATREDGPSTVVEGYYEADLESAYNEYKEALEEAGYGILFDEIEEHDSEISWQSADEGRTGQVALRDECEQADRILLKVTNRPG